jgi:hypothetical protein
MKEFVDSDCFLDVVMASNAGREVYSYRGGNEEFDAASALKSKLDEAKYPLGSTALTEVTCTKCEIVFVVGPAKSDGRGERAAVYYDYNRQEDKNCPKIVFRDAAIDIMPPSQIDLSIDIIDVPTDTRPLLDINLCNVAQAAETC